VDGKQTIAQLARKYSRSKRWIRESLDHHTLPEKVHSPRPITLAADATFWGRKSGVLVARDPVQRENILWKEIVMETPAEYRTLRDEIERLGYVIQGIVLDGKRGVREVFRDIPVQYCQFHQMKTVTRYLTRKPKMAAGQDLRLLALTLPRTDKKEFTERLQRWHERWKEFLNERTPCSCCKPNRWPYTHRKLRAAYRSLRINLPYLFTHQKHPELQLPNTTNTLDGSFSHLKNHVGLHRGKTSARRYKIIQEILKRKEDEK